MHLGSLSRIQRPHSAQLEHLANNSPLNKVLSVQTPQPLRAASLVQNPPEQEPLERQEPLGEEVRLALSERTPVPLGIRPRQPHPLPLEPVLNTLFYNFADLEAVHSRNLDNKISDLLLFPGVRIHRTKLLQKKNPVQIIAPTSTPSP